MSPAVFANRKREKKTKPLVGFWTYYLLVVIAGLQRGGRDNRIKRDPTNKDTARREKRAAFHAAFHALYFAPIRSFKRQNCCRRYYD